MWQAVGAVLGHAVGIAISPAAIIAVILVLFSAKKTVNSLLYLAGWVLGVGVTFFVVASVADAADVSTSTGASNGEAIAQLLLGALFFLLAVAFALLMTVLNPKNLALLLSAGSEAATYGLSSSELLGVTLVFTLVASVGVGVPVIDALAAGDSATATLTSWRTWMVANSATIMIVLFVILGAKMAGSAISSLAG